MTRAVRKPAPDDRASALDRAAVWFADAEYARCLELLACVAASDAATFAYAILLARARLRAGDLRAAEAASSDACARAKDPSEIVVANLVRGTILRALGSTREAAAAFAVAATALPHADDAARGEYAYHSAIVAWDDGDVARAEAIVEGALASAPDAVRAMLVQLLGWIELRRERYPAAAEHFLAALDLAARAQQRDLRLYGRLLNGLAIIASETIDRKLAQRYDAHLSAMRWTSGNAREHFNTITCQRFLALLRGDLPAAWQLSREAVAIAPNPTFLAIGETNAAVVSALVGDTFAAGVQFAAAWAAIERVSWSTADKEERVALTNFAIEAAGTFPAQARSAVTLYRNITGKRDPRLVFHDGDRRLQAFESMAAGRVSEALGNTKAAIENYERSLQLWIAVDYRMRAALVASDLRRLTSDPRYDHDIAVALARAPDAWFRGASVPVAERESPVALLTKAERTVLAHLLGGDGVRAIAEALGRSPHTVQNHTRRIFAAFEVRKRTALLARCATEGITAASLR